MGSSKIDKGITSVKGDQDKVVKQTAAEGKLEVETTPSGGSLQDINIKEVGGVAQTPRDWSGDLQNLDTPLSTRATEATLSTRATEATLATRLAPTDLNIEAVSRDLQVDVKSSALPAGAATEATLSTRATEATLATRLAPTDLNIDSDRDVQVDVKTLNDVYAALKIIVNQIARPMWVEPGTARVKSTIEAGTLPTVTTVSTVTNLAGFSAKDTLLNHQKKVSWALGVRARIT